MREIPILHRDDHLVVVDKPAGLLIEQQGLKAMTIGDAQISEVHANFIINRGSACASDVLALIELVRNLINDREDVLLELEIRVVEEEPPYVR